MRVVDANVLLYAVNSDARHHEASRTWLDRALGGGDSVGLSWMALLAFVRIATKGGLFPNPLTVEDAMAQVGEWLDQPGAHLVQPGRAHAAILSRLVMQGGGGNLVNDAHLAALAVEHRADVVSYDTDFVRFDEVTWRRPEDLL